MRLLIALLFALIVSGCFLTPCTPVEIERITLEDSVFGRDPIAAWPEGACRLISSEIYEPWAAYGIYASLESWECGCRA